MILAKSCDIEREHSKNGYKLLYVGVGVTISEGFRDVIKEAERSDDQLMKLTIIQLMGKWWRFHEKKRK